MRLHPRVAYQGFFHTDDERDRIIHALPELIPFRQTYHAAISIVDWDHRLPSKQLTLRLYLYYDEWTYGEGENAFFVWQWVNVELWWRMFIDQRIVVP